MARQPYLPNCDFPYHITARCNNKSPFPIPLRDTWLILLDLLWKTHINYNLNVFQFVLMPNHFHLVAQTPDANCAAAMRYFLCESAKKINYDANRINRLYGGRHFKSLINNYNYMHNVYRYVYQNPVRAGLCERVEEYEFSSIRMLLGLNSIELPLSPDDTLMHDIDGALKWLNNPIDNKHLKSIRAGIRKSLYFEM